MTTSKLINALSLTRSQHSLEPTADTEKIKKKNLLRFKNSEIAGRYISKHEPYQQNMIIFNPLSPASIRRAAIKAVIHRFHRFSQKPSLAESSALSASSAADPS